MHIGKLGSRQKVVLLIIGLLILFALVLTGKMFYKDKTHTGKTPIANEELLILGTADSVEGLAKDQVYTDKGIYFTEEEALLRCKWLCENQVFPISLPDVLRNII